MPDVLGLQGWYRPALKAEAAHGHKRGTIISARYAFLLVDLFFPMKAEVRDSASCSYCDVCVDSSLLHAPTHMPAAAAAAPAPAPAAAQL